MQKGAIGFIFVASLLIFSIGSVSAFSFSDFFDGFFGKITGNAVASGCPSDLVAYY